MQKEVISISLYMAGILMPFIGMLKKRNTSVHIYNEDEVDEMIVLIHDSFIPAFTALKDTLVKKLVEAESDWT